MNKPLSDEELQIRMMEYNAQVIDTIVGLFDPKPSRPLPNLSDEEKSDSWKAAKKISEARSLLQDAAVLSPDLFGHAIAGALDELPSNLAAEEMVSGAYRG